MAHIRNWLVSGRNSTRDCHQEQEVILRLWESAPRGTAVGGVWWYSLISGASARSAVRFKGFIIRFTSTCMSGIFDLATTLKGILYLVLDHSVLQTDLLVG